MDDYPSEYINGTRWIGIPFYNILIFKSKNIEEFIKKFPYITNRFTHKYLLNKITVLYEPVPQTLYDKWRNRIKYRSVKIDHNSGYDMFTENLYPSFKSIDIKPKYDDRSFYKLWEWY